MKSITVRGLDDLTAETLRLEAQRQGKSVNQFVLDTLRERLGLKKGKRFTTVHHDMDHLFGRWSEREFEQVQKTIDAERRMDGELWR